MSFDRWLGPLATPPVHVYRAIWSQPASVPGIPFVGLRIYEETLFRQHLREPETGSRTLLYEYRQP